MKRVFRFGVGVTEAPRSAKACAELARKVEDMGFSTLLFSDHMGLNQLAPLIGSMAALSATTTLRVGTQVLGDPFRNPAVLAREIASLDRLSEGRFEFGIGAGWPPDSTLGRRDSDQTGVDLGDPVRRVEHFYDTVRFVKTYLSADEPFDFEGNQITLKGVNPFPRSVQGDRMPIMVGCAGPKMLRFAAREATIINIPPRPPIVGRTSTGVVGFGMTVGEAIDIVRQEAGERFAEIEFCINSSAPASRNPSITDNSTPWIQQLAKALNTSEQATLEMPHTLIGTPDYLVEKMERERELLGITYRVIPDRAIDEFAAIVASVAGT